MKAIASAATCGIGGLRRTSAGVWLVAAAIAVTIAVRLIPLYLPAADAYAWGAVRAAARAEVLRNDPSAAALDPTSLDAAVAEWSARHADALAPVKRQAEQRFLDAYTFRGEDGRRHVYLGDEDGYYWLQLARTLLARGSVCDRIEGGACIDALTNAPVGQAIEYVRSPHVYAIAALERLIGWLRPGFPLSSAGVLVPMLLSALMMIPAFLIAQSVSNRFGGLMAVLLLSLNSVILARTGDGDDDIWTVALPILSTALITASFSRRGWRGRLLLSGLGGATLALLVNAWKGWPLFVLATLAGLVALAAWALLSTVIARVRGEPRNYTLLGRVCLCALAAAAGFAGAGWLLGVEIDLKPVIGALTGLFWHAPAAPGPVDTAPMPDVFRTVAELTAVDAKTLQRSIGPVATGLGLLGFPLALWSPRGRRAWVTLALLLSSPGLAALLGGLASSRPPMVAIPALLGLAAALANWLGVSPPSDRAAATGIIGLAWLGAALWMSFEGARFVLLAAVPLALAAGAALGHVASAVGALRALPARYARSAGGLAAGVLGAAALGPVAIAGVEMELAHTPTITSAWTAGFDAIRAQSDSDAVLDIWWDYGHWAKYFTQRKVVLDGALLQNRAVYWMARALAATSDSESVGLLRMMNCGLVPDPDGGRADRPYDMLVRWSADPGLAFRSVTQLSRSPREQAEAFLRGAGLPTARAKALLDTVYCTPPQSFLVLGSDLIGSRGWLQFGLWDPGLAYIARLAHHSSLEAALPVIERKYGLSESAARGYYAAAKQLQTEDEEIAFATPGGQMWSRDWQACTLRDEALHCALDVGEFALGPHLLDLSVDPRHPDRTRIRMVPRPGAEPVDAIPALVEIAGSGQLRDVPLSEATVNLAVLVDPEQKRAFVGTPRVLHSTLVRLALLDGRYSPQFQKIYDQVGIDRNRVTVWRILWQP